MVLFWYYMVHLRYNSIECYDLDEIGANILAYLFNGRGHMRKMEREIGVPHSTFLRKIIQLEKNGFVDYSMAGRNKEYFLKNNLKTKKALEIVEGFKMINILKKHPSLEPLFVEILKKSDAEMIILFGSYAKGIPKEESDIDIYVESEDAHLKKKLEELNSKISVKIGKFDMSSLLIKEIIKNHIVIRGAGRFYEQVFK